MSRHNSEQLLHQTITVQENRLEGGGGNDCSFVDLTDPPDEFYREVMPRLARIAKRKGMNRDECEDMAQQAWLQALEKKDKFPGKHTSTEVSSWVAAIVHNVTLNTLLDRHPTQALEEGSMEPIDRKEAERTHTAEVMEELAPLLARLEREAPVNYRFVCERYLASREVLELAAETGRPAHEVSYRLHRGLRKMRAYAPKSDCRHEELLRGMLAKK